jgi:two-component system, OmpR family, phosphate regulon sensor histidine kinase PhoR
VKSKLRLKSFLRVIPAALLGLLPMGFVDDRILEFEYQLRGARPLSEQILLVSVPTVTSIRALPESFAISAPKCIDITDEAFLLSPCKRIDLSNKFSVSSISDLQIELSDAFNLKTRKIVSAEQLLYSGRSSIFRQIELEEFTKMLPDPNSFVVLVSSNFRNGPLLSTPMGLMNQTDVFLNYLANLIEGRFLKRGTLASQAALSIAAITLTSYFVYFLPTAITLIYLLGLFVFFLLCSFISFETFDFQLLIAAPMLSSVFTYILGVSDRLDQRDRFEWSLLREKESLLRLDEMRNNFLSLISHDLKTPIAKIQAISERLLQEPAFGPEQRGEIEKILTANKEMFRNISSLLLLSRIEAQEFQLRREPTDLTALLSEAVNSHEALAERRKVKITKEFDPLFLVDMDQALIREVASNLLGNAIKYSPEGSVIVVRCGDLDNDQALSPPQPSVWFEVQDAGPGIPLKEQRQVFEKFFRGANEHAPAEQPIQGSGLGLYLSAFFVEKHNGKISLFSRSNQDGEPSAEDARNYFRKGESGTVMRVALPQDSLYD